MNALTMVEREERGEARCRIIMLDLRNNSNKGAKGSKRKEGVMERRVRVWCRSGSENSSSRVGVGGRVGVRARVQAGCRRVMSRRLGAIIRCRRSEGGLRVLDERCGVWRVEG